MTQTAPRRLQVGKIGELLPRVDAPPKVKGEFAYSSDLIERHAGPSDAEIREALAGNLCRCTGYEKIMEAVRLAAARRAGVS